MCNSAGTRQHIQIVEQRSVTQKLKLDFKRHLKKKDYMERRESLVIPTNNFDLKPEINVYDDKVMIASWSEKLGIIIESQEIAAALKQLFELAWKEAQRLDAHME